MKFYTNKDLKGTKNLKGTTTIVVNEDISGKFSGEILKKGSKIVVSGVQNEVLSSVIDDGNCEWDLVLDITNRDKHLMNDLFTLSYTEDKTNFSIDSVNC